MKKYLLKISGLLTLVILIHASASAQQSRARSGRDDDSTGRRMNEDDEIIIKTKGDKNAKVTIEIKDGQVLVDGKPVSEYNNDDLSVYKLKRRMGNARSFSFSGPGGAQAFVMPAVPDVDMSPFRDGSGSWNFDGDSFGGNSNRAFLGVTSENAKEGEGAQIKEVSKGSAAEKAGLHTGDVITKVDAIAVDGPESLSEAIHKYKPEDKVTVTFKRDGKEQQVTASLAKQKTTQVYTYRNTMPRGQFKEYMAPEAMGWGNMRQQKLGIRAQDTEDGKGVKVLEIDEESAAEKAGIKEGDVITRFDGKEVNSVTELAEDARVSKDKSNIKVNLLRDGKAQEIEIKIPKKLKTANL